MATIAELEQEIRDIQDGISSQYVSDTQRQKLQTILDAKKSELATMQLPQAGALAPKPQAPMATPSVQGEENGLAAIAQMLNAFMSGGGMGADSFEIKQMIKQYLDTEKVNLSELDQSVLDEIKRNQRVTIELPNFGLKFEMDKSDAEIPNIFSIIDDALAGNNVFLIGEAGGGKTYTAELVAKLLKRISLVINCSQYTSPTEILGGQTIEGYKEGKLIKAWKDGYLLILDEMPKLDPNTAGLFNDALAKSSKTRPDDMARISSTNPEEPPVERNVNFCCIATGNIYPNSPDTRRYVGNNQQDLSLLDRFSGSVYFVEFSQYIDETSCRYQFLYDMLVGNYYEYMSAKRQGNTLPTARGLRTTMEHLDMKNYALVSYRTLTAFRIAFEYELVRAIAISEGKVVSTKGKTVSQTFENYLVAFPKDAKTTLINTTKFTTSFIDNQVADAIKTVVDNKDKVSGFIKILTKAVKDVAGDAFAQSKNWIIAEQYLKP